MARSQPGAHWRTDVSLIWLCGRCSRAIRQLSPCWTKIEIDYTQDIEPHARSSEKCPSGCRDALPHRRSAWRQPFLSGADQGLLTRSTKIIVWAHCRQQFCLAGCDVFCRDLRTRLFWVFAASSADRRRPDLHCDRLVAAVAERRVKTGGTENRPAAGHNPPGILSFDIATDRGPCIHLCDD